MRYLFSTLLIIMAGTFSAFAEDRPKLEPLPYIPPPPGIVDPDLEPRVTIKKEGGDHVQEYRIKGRLYMVKVTPPHGRPYYLIDTRGDGQLRRFDELSPDLLVPLWVVKEF